MSYGPWAIEDDPRIAEGNSSALLEDDPGEAGCDEHRPVAIHGCRECEEADVE